MIELVPVQVWHIEVVADGMRKADMLECERMVGFGPMESLVRSVSNSHWAETALMDGLPVGIGGIIVDRQNPEIAAPWCLGTDAGYEDVRGLWTMMEGLVDGWREEYEMLVNRVDAQNVEAIKWLKLIGFTVHPPEDTGVNGDPFRVFIWKRGPV